MRYLLVYGRKFTGLFSPNACRSRHLIDHVTIRFPVGHLLLVVLWYKASWPPSLPVPRYAMAYREYDAMVDMSGELWSTIHKVVHVSLDQPKWTFSVDYISALRGCWLLKFLHALQIHQGLLTHTTKGDGVSDKILRVNIKILRMNPACECL